MMFKIFFLLLGLCCSSELNLELENLKQLNSSSYSSSFDSDCSDLEKVVENEKCCEMDIIPDDILQYMFRNFFEIASRMNYFQTCKRYHDVVLNHFRKDAFVYYNGRPVLRILKLFKNFRNPNLSEAQKTGIKDLLLTNCEVREFSELIFPLETNPLLSFFIKFNWLSVDGFMKNRRSNESIGSPAFDTKSHMMYLLCKKVDPEVVTILVLLYPEEMWKGIRQAEGMKLITDFGHSHRAKEITKLTFETWKFLILDLLSTKDGYQWLYSLNLDQLEKLLSYSYIPSKHSSKALRLLLSHCVRIKCNVRSLFKLIPPSSVGMGIDLFHALLLLDFSMVEIMGICKDRSKLYSSLTVPEGLVPLLLRAGVRCEDLVHETLTGMNGFAIQPIWNQDHYKLAKELGYSDAFLATMKSKMRYQY